MIDQGGTEQTIGAMDWSPGTTSRTSPGWRPGPAGPFSGAQPEVNPDKWIRVTVDPKSPQVFSFTSEQAP